MPDARPTHRSAPRPRFGLAAVSAAVGLVAFAPRPAAADLVRLTSGAVVSVERCRFEGDAAVFDLRSGGQVRMPRVDVIEVLPDEYERPRPEDLVPPAAAVAVAATWAPAAVAELVERLARAQGVDARLALAIVRVESNYRADAVSPKGAMGLMQLMPGTARQYAVADPFDPVQNLEAGLRHLRSLIDRFRDLPVALAAYNAGEGAVSKYGGVPPYRETQDYVRRILSLVERP